MKLRALCHLSGAFGRLAPGDEFDATADNAARLIRRRQAAPAEDPPKKKAAKPQKE